MKKDNFLNYEQKQIKQKIMEDLLDSFNKNTLNNLHIFSNENGSINSQSILDLIGSILVMFNREILTKYIMIFNLEHQQNIIMDDLFDTIKKQVNEYFEKSMQ